MESYNCLMRAEKIQSGGYPERDQLAGDSKLLNFYTGFNCFTVFMAIFEFVAKGVAHSDNPKLTKFNYLLTFMKLTLNLSHDDLAFRFNVSQPTVSRSFVRWILTMP